MARRIIGRTKQGRDIAAWMVKANPEVWDVVAWAGDHDWIDGWRLADSYRVPMMKAGDLCFLWVTGPANADYEPGVWAAGVVTGGAAEDAGSGSLWVDSAEQAKRRPYIPLNLRILDDPIPRADLAADPRFESSEIIRQPQMGNPLIVTPDELAAIEDWSGDLGDFLNDLPDLEQAVEEELRTPDSESAQSWGDGYRDMLYAFADAGLVAPPVPEALRPQLRRLGPWLWATRDIDPFAMYMFDEYIEEAIAAATADYVAISHAGHGINSYGLNYHLVCGAVALFTQDGWGGGYMNPVLSRADIATTFSRVYELLRSLPEDPLTQEPPRVLLAWSGFRMVCSATMQMSPSATATWVDVEDQESLFELGSYYVGLLPAAIAERRRTADWLQENMSERDARRAGAAAESAAGAEPTEAAGALAALEWEASYLDAVIAETQRINREKQERRR